jgi:formylglycine-generating enzyme
MGAMRCLAPLAMILSQACGGVADGDAAGRAGAGGAAGAGGGGAAGSSGSGTCPSGLPGSALLEVDASSGRFCIDATEVTRGQYLEFVAALSGGAAVSQPQQCIWNEEFLSDNWNPDGQSDDHPMTHVDWCDAFAYCAWAGKRLCRGVNGESLIYRSWEILEHPDFDPMTSEWYRACSGDGAYRFGYGNDEDPDACPNLTDSPLETAPVTGMPGCRSPVPGLEELVAMSGNANEWEDACEGNLGASDPCLLRGGTFITKPSEQACGIARGAGRALADNRTGVRCCADVR